MIRAEAGKGNDVGRHDLGKAAKHRAIRSRISYFTVRRFFFVCILVRSPSRAQYLFGQCRRSSDQPDKFFSDLAGYRLSS
jgi:hypothetical protein